MDFESWVFVLAYPLLDGPQVDHTSIRLSTTDHTDLKWMFTDQFCQWVRLSSGLLSAVSVHIEKAGHHRRGL